MRSGTVELDLTEMATTLGAVLGPGDVLRPGPCRVVTEVDTRYLDADEDGLLDAVEITESVVVVSPDFRRVVSTSRYVAGQIGDDGVPAEVLVRSTP